MDKNHDAYTLNNSSCRKAARERIPRSIDNYVTGVSERSQRICNLNYDGYKQQGFSLPEVLIAALLLSVSLLGLMNYYQVLINGFQRQWQVRQAWQLAHQRLDEFSVLGNMESQLLTTPLLTNGGWSLTLSTQSGGDGCQWVTATTETPSGYRAVIVRLICI